MLYSVSQKSGIFLALALAASLGTALPCHAGQIESPPMTREEKCGTCYEVFVYSFCDSDGDGIGDLSGLTSRLDYINDGDPETFSDLGCDQIWTMPVFPSPTYHKYDVTDYEAIDPQYGTMEDFDRYLEECSRRGIRVILDLPLNHTSTEHPWFLEAAGYLRSLPEGSEPSSEACPFYEYYCWSKAPAEGYAKLEGTDYYYEARFWEGMPDLNLDSEAVRAEISDILRFWLEKGVYGFRLDAVTSYYTGSASQNIAFLKWLKDTAVSISPNAYMVGEAWTDQTTYASYYESGIDSLFDFAFSSGEGLIASAVKGSLGGLRFAEELEQEDQLYASISETAVNAPFYTNHDMARGTGYYAWDDGSHTKLALAVNLLMSGNAFLYYGEELGMKGSGRDENKRAPMYWTAGPDASGMCAGPAEMENFSMKWPAWDEQAADPLSIYNYCRDALRIRQVYPVIREGMCIADEELSGGAVCVVHKIPRPEGRQDVQPLLILVNFSEELQRVDLKGKCSSRDLLEELSVSGLRCRKAGEILYLPPFGIAVFPDAQN